MSELGQLRSDDANRDVLSSQRTKALIRNEAFNHFWQRMISPRDSIRRVGLITKLTSILTALPAPQSSVDEGNDIQLPAEPYGYGLIDQEIMLLVRGAPRGFVEEIVAAIDIDDTGVITAAKIDIATRAVPIDASLRDTLLFLAHQGGSKVVLPAQEFRDTEVMLSTALQSLRPEVVEKDAKMSSHSPLSSMVRELRLYSISATEMIVDDTQVAILEMMIRSNGWGIITGECSVGKTFRVLSAGRQFLAQNPQSASDGNSRDNVDSNSSYRSLASYGSLYERNRRNFGKTPRNFFYLNLTGCKMRNEVLASISSQLGLLQGGGIGGIEETEQRLLRFLGQQSKGTVLIIDHAYVSPKSLLKTAQKARTERNVCAIIYSIFKSFMKDILIITVLTVNPTLLPSNSNKLFEELFLCKEEKEEKEEILEHSEVGDVCDTSLDLSKLSLKLSLHTLSSPLRDYKGNRINNENTESEMTIMTGFPKLRIINVKPLNLEFSNIMAKKFITNNNHLSKNKNDNDNNKTGKNDKNGKNDNAEVYGKREIFVSALSRGHIGLVKILSNVSVGVLEDIYSSIPDLGLLHPKDVLLLLFQHNQGGLKEDEKILMTCLSPLTQQKMTFGKHLAWALSKRIFLDDKTKWSVAWEKILSLGWIARTSLTLGRTENLYSVSGQFLDVPPSTDGDFSPYQTYLRHVAVRAARLNDQLIASDIAGGIIDNNSPNKKGETKAELRREIDSLTPHLQKLFSIWIPKGYGDERRKREKRKKTSFGEFMTTHIKENEESELDYENVYDGRIRTSDDNDNQEKNDDENDKKIDGTNTKNAKRESAEKTVILSELEKFFLTQAEDLSVILAGRVCAVASLRFSTPDVIHLSAGIAKTVKEIPPGKIIPVSTNSVKKDMGQRFRTVDQESSVTAVQQLTVRALIGLSDALALGAAQESWLSGGQSSEKNTLEKNILKKKEGIENKKFLLKQSIVLEECLKLLDQSGAARDSSRVSTTHVGASRLTMQLAVVYRELGRPDQAKSLLNSLLLRLRMKQEHAQDERRSSTENADSDTGKILSQKDGKGLESVVNRSLSFSKIDDQQSSAERSRNLIYDDDEDDDDHGGVGWAYNNADISNIEEKKLLPDTLYQLALCSFLYSGTIIDQSTIVGPSILTQGSGSGVSGGVYRPGPSRESSSKSLMSGGDIVITRGASKELAVPLLPLHPSARASPSSRSASPIPLNPHSVRPRTLSSASSSRSASPIPTSSPSLSSTHLPLPAPAPGSLPYPIPSPPPSGSGNPNPVPYPHFQRPPSGSTSRSNSPMPSSPQITQSSIHTSTSTHTSTNTSAYASTHSSPPLSNKFGPKSPDLHPDTRSTESPRSSQGRPSPRVGLGPMPSPRTAPSSLSANILSNKILRINSLGDQEKNSVSFASDILLERPGMYREMAYIPMSTLPSHTGSYDMEGDTESQSIVLTKVVGFLLEAKNLYQADIKFFLSAVDVDIFIGNVLRVNDRLDKAKKHYDSALQALRERGDGSLHPRHAELLAGLACITDMDIESSPLTASLSSESLATLLMLYPETHPCVWTAKVTLAEYLEALDRDEEAIGLFEHALTVARTASTDSSLLEPLLDALKSVKTKSAYESSTSVLTENDGLEKERRAAKLNEKERAAERAGKESVREEKDRRALAVPQILLRIAVMQGHAERQTVAEGHFKEAVSLLKDLEGIGSIAVADALCLLATCLTQQSYSDSSTIGPLDATQAIDRKAHEKFLEALRSLREAGSIYSNALSEFEEGEGQGFGRGDGISDPDSKAIAKNTHNVISCLLQLAALNESHSRFFEAKDNFEAIMSIYQKFKMTDRERLADVQALYGRMLVNSANALGESDQSLAERGGDLMEARTLYENALKTYRRLHGELHITVGRTLLALGGVYMDLEEWEEALPFLDDALIVLAESPGGDSPEMAECHNMMGSTLQALKVPDEAKEAFKESLRIYVDLYGPEDTHVAKVTNDFATLLEELGEKQEALFFYEKALATVRRLKGDFNPQVLVILDNLASLFRDMDLFDEAMDVDAQAEVIATRLIARIDNKKGGKQKRTVPNKANEIKNPLAPIDRALAEYDVPPEKKNACVVM